MKASMQSSSKVKGSMSSSSSHKGQHQTTTEESQTVSDVPQIKKPKSSEGKDSDQTDPVSVDSENEISSTENHPSELLPVSDREISPKEV
ncbi:hypothetical protein Anas_01454 [Armadillidium nasatum]|uniref:Uncharacterized protein n=1 Tax=Armadillidium nasatum TaxID=96803 RepID=A0A5N5TH50_9CRUS|nr:hypothetical protein Anas_01454 [Armadillidium nasatum]